MLRRIIGICSGFLLCLAFIQWMNQRTLHVAVILPSATDSGKSTKNSTGSSQKTEEFLKGIELSIQQYNQHNAKYNIKLIEARETKVNDSGKQLPHLPSNVFAVISGLDESDPIDVRENLTEYCKAKELPLIVHTSHEADSNYGVKIAPTMHDEAKYMVLLTKHILNQSKVKIVFSNDKEGRSLRDSLLRYCKLLDITVESTLSLEQFHTSFNLNGADYSSSNSPASHKLSKNKNSSKALSVDTAGKKSSKTLDGSTEGKNSSKALSVDTAGKKSSKTLNAGITGKHALKTISKNTTAESDNHTILYAVPYTPNTLAHNLDSKNISRVNFVCTSGSIEPVTNQNLLQDIYPDCVDCKFYAVDYQIFNTRAAAYMNGVYKQKHESDASQIAVYGYDSGQALISLFESAHKTLSAKHKFMHPSVNSVRRKISQIINGQELSSAFAEEKHRPLHKKSITRYRHDYLSEHVLSFLYDSKGKFELCPLQLYPLGQYLTQGVMSQGVDKTQELEDFWQKTHLVRCGININSVLELNTNDIKIDFYLWLRHAQDFPEATNISFLHLVDKAGTAASTTQTDNSKSELLDRLDRMDLVKETTVDDMTYRLYRCVGTFQRNPFDQLHKSFYEQESNFGISFKHKYLDYSKVRYITESAFDNLKHLSSTGSLLSNKKWMCTDVEAFESLPVVSSLGSPESPNDKAIVSIANLQVDMTKLRFSIFDLISYSTAKTLLIASLCIILFSLFLVRISMLDFVGYAGLLMSSQYMVMDAILTSELLQSYRFTVSVLFDIVWWFIFAWCASYLTHRFVWSKLRSNRAPPRLITVLVDGTYYLIASLCVLAFILGQPVASMITSISILSLAFVMAVQINISNVLGGFFINLEGKLRRGDWINLNGQDLQVASVGWRSTAFKTASGNYMSIINTQLSGMAFTNYTYPENVYQIRLSMSTHMNTDSLSVIRVIEDACKANEVVQTDIMINKYAHNQVFYDVDLTLKNFDGTQSDIVKGKYYSRIWHALARHSIPMVIVPVQDINLLK